MLTLRVFAQNESADYRSLAWHWALKISAAFAEDFIKHWN
jgi:hypothetical protein